MKKLFFVMACVIGMMTFTSCDPSAIDDLMKQKPEISLLQGEDLFTHNTGVRVGTELNFQVKVAPNSSSMSPIANVIFTVKDLNGNLLKSESPEFEDPSVENIFDFSFTAEDSETTYVFTFTVILNKAACRGIAPDTTIAALEKMKAAGVILVENAAALQKLR